MRYVSLALLLSGVLLFAPVACNEPVEPVDPYGPSVDPVSPGVDPANPGDDPSGHGVDPSGPSEPVAWNYEGDGTGVVLVVGGGASGVAAGIQAARLGCETVIVEETPWLGGMLTSAGVSCIDGCYNLRGGIFGEFTDALAARYGSYGAMKTGWVSNICFSPKDGAKIFEDMASREKNLTVVHGLRFVGLTKQERGWNVHFEDANGSRSQRSCDVLIDATELGDVARAAGVRYHVGMDAPSYAGESLAIGPNDVVQDITMVMTVKDYGRDVTIARPDGYDESLYADCCRNAYNIPFDTGQTLHSPSDMLSYGLLPGGEIMLNWPTFGNDFYVNMIDMSYEERQAAVRKAKLHSLGYLYFIQTRLGYNHLGLADDQYPTEDRMPFFPYHRESRRIESEHVFSLEEARNPYGAADPVYRTGVAVGDYPVDHHHYQYPDWKSVKINFPSIPSFTVPLGVLVPEGVEDLIVAEKSVGVTNLINGSTRLQPVVMELGQAAGVLASFALKNGVKIREVNVRAVQDKLLSAGARLQPYLDCDPRNAIFASLQRIGCTGILRSEGKTVGWTNESRMRADDPLRWNELYLEELYGVSYNPSSDYVTAGEFYELLASLVDAPDAGAPDAGASAAPAAGGSPAVPAAGGSARITRGEAAALLDTTLHPFESFGVDFDGNYFTIQILSER